MKKCKTFCDICGYEVIIKECYKTTIFADKYIDVCNNCINEFIIRGLKNETAFVMSFCKKCNGTGKYEDKEWDYDHSKYIIKKCEECGFR